MFFAYSLPLLLLSLIGKVLGHTNEEYLLQTESLPEDRNFMPSLSNGHLGYTVFGDAIYMNGVYNGAAGESKRARLPNWLNISAEICDQLECFKEPKDTKYEMDLLGGYFRYQQNFPTLGVTIVQRSYAHRYYNRALVYELVATRTITTPLNSTLSLKLSQHPGAASDAFDFVIVDDGRQPGKYYTLRGRTRIVEHSQFQNATREIYVSFSEHFEQLITIDWPATQSQLYYRFIISADLKQQVASRELQDVLNLSSDALLASHTNAWQKFWQQQFAVELVGDLELWRIINAGIFYLANSLPSLATNQPNNPYYGLSPAGLPRGGFNQEYLGHNFWDTEIWMLPVVTQFSYEWSKQLFDYRYQHLSVAQYNAVSRGNRGARYPWESAYTGIEVTQPCCPVLAEHEIHITPDIAFSMEKFFAQTNDRAWLCTIAWPMLHEIAEFLVSRVNCTTAPKVCHLLDVVGPDEDHEHVDDNVYTNVISRRALEFAAYVGQTCRNATHDAKIIEWLSIATQLLILYDEKLDYHPQHRGYTTDEIIKQADTILLGYPLEWPMNKSTQINDLRTYSKVTRESGPAMTWSMFATNYILIGDSEDAHPYFEKGYKRYVHNVFKVWRETAEGDEFAPNFLTGIGGFLQALLSGYAGISYARKGGKVTFQLRSGILPPSVTRLSIKSIKFSKNIFNLDILKESTQLNCFHLGENKLELVMGEQRTVYNKPFNVTIKPNETLTLNII